MLKIGESLNSSIPKTLALLEPFDEDGVRALIRAQKAAGAAVLDVNTALCPDELSVMRRVVSLINEEGDLVPMFDSPDPAVLSAMLEETDGAAFLNSVTLTERREVIALCAEQIRAGRDLHVVALPVGDALPTSAEERREFVKTLIDSLVASGIPEERLWLDLLIEAVATDTAAASRVFDTLSFTKEAYPNVKTLCGLSNISFGLPMRAKLNGVFAAMLVARGLDGAIISVTSPEMRRTLASCELLLGEDDYCMNFLSLYRELEG